VTRERRTVLLVDDHPGMRELIRTILEIEEIDVAVIEAESAADAIAAWQSSSPDLVVLDYRLPRPEGLDVAARMRAEQPSLQIVLFTAFLDPLVVEEAARVGGITCLTQDELRRLPGLVRQLLG
jgi:CheY-like chemotaxis protein